jgi:mannose-6-phosphate isomerase-like protein (cupin superfamily)
MCSIPPGRPTHGCMRSSQNRDARRGEVRVGERADRHRDVLRVGPVVDGRAAARAEEERALLAVVGDPHVLARVALNPYLLARPACLHPERAPCAPLAGEAVADRDPDRVALDLDRELPARAGRTPRRHVGTVLHSYEKGARRARVRPRIAAVPYTLRNLKEDLEDVGSRFDGAPDLEFRLATEALELEQSGLSYQRVPPGYRFPYGHTHQKQEEVYVVVRGSGRMKLDDEIVELKEWDVVRVPPGTWRGYEAGPGGLEIIVIGAPNLGDARREDVEGQRDWWAD